MRHSGTARLETEHLILRQLLPADAPAMYRNWANDPRVTKYLRWEPHCNAAETTALLEAWALLYQNPDYYQWAIVEKATGEVFGSMSIYCASTAEGADDKKWVAPGLDFSSSVWEPGYCIGHAYWNRGYTTEALKAVVRYWFESTDSPWLACCHAIENPASGRVMQKAGFVYDHDDCYHKFNGTPVDCKVYVLTRAAFEKGNLL